ncbi:MAG: ketopantoate reductase family protein [Clostridiales bacterium]|nr:ketopantoate reductase family protein [Clostridiales bacterium]
MRILIYGAGVIGSLYAVLFSKAGYEVSVYARGRRLQELKTKGLLYRDRDSVQKADVTVLAQLSDEDCYAFIFLAVRAEQAEPALRELQSNLSPTVVTMINTVKGYEEWEAILGAGRLLPAFPGAGGSIVDGVLDAALTPSLLQPTTFGEINGQRSERTVVLAQIFKRSGIPYQIVPNMHHWQISHLGLVVPLADAYYRSDEPANVYRDKDIMAQTARELKSNFQELSKRFLLLPLKFHLLRICPQFLLRIGLTMVFRSHFGDVFMYRHAMKSPEEMRQLHRDFYNFMGGNDDENL